MNNKEELKELIHYWFEKSQESLDAARDELKAGRLSFSVNRIYYACFYAVNAILLQEKLRFKKHSGVRTAFHQHLVKSGKLAVNMESFMMSFLRLVREATISNLSALRKIRLKIGCNRQVNLLRQLNHWLNNCYFSGGGG